MELLGKFSTKVDVAADDVEVDALGLLVSPVEEVAASVREKLLNRYREALGVIDVSNLC